MYSTNDHIGELVVNGFVEQSFIYCFTSSNVHLAYANPEEPPKMAPSNGSFVLVETAQSSNSTQSYHVLPVIPGTLRGVKELPWITVQPDSEREWHRRLQWQVPSTVKPLVTHRRVTRSTLDKATRATYTLLQAKASTTWHLWKLQRHRQCGSWVE